MVSSIRFYRPFVPTPQMKQRQKIVARGTPARVLTKILPVVGFVSTIARASTLLSAFLRPEIVMLLEPR